MEISKDFYEFFYNKTGIIFDENKKIVLTKIINFAKKNGFESLSKFEQEVRINKTLLQELINRLSINETYFFREPKAFDILIETIDKTKHNDILVVPSSTGEEAYSIAILFKERGLNAYKIKAIDINSDVIERAKNGVFSPRSFRQKKEIQKRFFTPQNENFEINKDLKTKIEFILKNIFDPSLANLGKFDYIFCRNLFIYFDETSKKKAEKILANLLKPNGILITAGADYPKNEEGLEKIFSGSMYYYKKPN